MFNISFGEILVFGIIALIVLGPEKLPQTLRTVLLKYKKIKEQLTKIQNDIENELEIIELRKLMQNELKKIKDNEDQLKMQLSKMQQEIENFQEKKITVSNESINLSAFQIIEKRNLNIPFVSSQHPITLSREDRVA